MLFRFALGILVCTLPWGAFAQVPGAERKDCVGIYSIQKRSCVVENIYRCETPAGVLWRKEEFEADESMNLEVLTEDGQILYAADSVEGPFVSGLIENTDPLSVRDMLASGVDYYDHIVRLHLPIFVDPINAPLQGRLQNLNEQVEIDGIVFDRARMDIKIWVNAAEINGYEDWYIDRATGAFAYGETKIFNKLYAQEPVQVIKPGEPGFMSERPLYDCGELSNAAPLVGGVQHG